MTDKSIEAKARFLGESYALGAQAYESNSIIREEINKINASIYQLVNNQPRGICKNCQRKRILWENENGFCTSCWIINTLRASSSTVRATSF